MKVAFHFDSHAEEYSDFYGLAITDKFFRVLLAEHYGHIHLKIFQGDLIHGHFRDPKERAKIVQSLLEDKVWRDLDQEKFASALSSTVVYVILVEGLTKLQRDFINAKFKVDETYLGALQINESNRMHWLLYTDSLLPCYRFIDGELRIMYPTIDDKDFGKMKHYKKFNFKSAVWENSGLLPTIFDRYNSYEHAERVSKLNDTLAVNFPEIAEEILIRFRDLDPRLYKILFSAFKVLKDARTEEDYAFVAVSCRRFLNKLANALFSDETNTKWQTDERVCLSK